MNHNPLNLKIGEIVNLDHKIGDKEYRSHQVTILNFSPNKLFATVTNNVPEKEKKIRDCWEVMTNRLSKTKESIRNEKIDYICK
jgi:CDP-diacylglycerol pyrophosphatase